MYVRRYVCNACMYVCMHACMYICMFVCNVCMKCMYVFMYVCMHACMHVCMYVCISRKKNTDLSSVFAKRTSKNIEFFQIFGKMMQEAQASKKAGRGNRAWDPCFATPGSPKTTFSGTSSNCRAVRGPPSPPPPSPPKNLHNRRRAGGVRGGGYPLSSLVSIRHAEQCRRI